MYAQLDFTNNRFKKVNLIGGVDVGITPELIDLHPAVFVSLRNREDVPINTFDWYYDTNEDIFLHFDELPKIDPEPIPPTQLDIIENMIIENALDTDFRFTMIEMSLEIE